MSSFDNKVFKALAKYFGYAQPEQYWQYLLASEPTPLPKSQMLGIGFSSFAVHNAPFIHALMRYPFPDWLRLGYVHHVEKDGEDKIEPQLLAPDWWDSGNYKNKIQGYLGIEAASVKNPFLNCYVSDDLPNLIDATANHPSRRHFQAIFCPEITNHDRDYSNKDIIRLYNGIELVKVATVCSGYGGLLIVAKIEKGEPNPPFSKDEEFKGYRIKDESLNPSDIKDKREIEDNRKKFINLLEVKNKQPDFFLRGIEGTNSFDRFQSIWDIERTHEPDNKDEYEKLQYLMATRGTINYSADTEESFDSIARLMESGKTLVLVAHPPILHNSWQLIKKSLNLDENKYVQQYRFNYGQWFGAQDYNLYVSKEYFTIQNIQKINDILHKVEQSRASISKNNSLPDFFYYNPNQVNPDSVKQTDLIEAQTSLEIKFLFEKACEELGFSTQPPITYSTTFMKLLLENSR